MGRIKGGYKTALGKFFEYMQQKEEQKMEGQFRLFGEELEMERKKKSLIVVFNMPERWAKGVAEEEEGKQP